jgi:hypothetical protein
MDERQLKGVAAMVLVALLSCNNNGVNGEITFVREIRDSNEPYHMVSPIRMDPFTEPTTIITAQPIAPGNVTNHHPSPLCLNYVWTVRL